ncbi:hypothetical protein C8F04DRAFT_1283471 [Mycena alexandri]|uniref:Uncharacterized protein n=1 Tax=Mycena alexandri TaxID=1745969 RepID=A0AAD6RVF5_9AGAR|nr:hypothetical protein C8F04DRAFT_1283471 [Mycena alexandri]
MAILPSRVVQESFVTLYGGSKFDEGKEEWVPFTARKRKAANSDKESGRGKKRKVVNSGDEPEEEGEGGGERWKTKNARLDHDSDDSNTPDSDDPDSDNPKLMWAEKMVKEAERDRERTSRTLRKKQAAIRTALLPLESPRSKGPRPIPKPAFKGAPGGTALHGGGTGPSFTPGASTSQLPKALSLSQIDGYQSGEESKSGGLFVSVHCSHHRTLWILVRDEECTPITWSVPPTTQIYPEHTNSGWSYPRHLVRTPTPEDRTPCHVVGTPTPEDCTPAETVHGSAAV